MQNASQNDSVLQAITRLETCVTERFDSVDARFISIDGRFDAVENRFTAIDERFDAVDDRFEMMDDRFAFLTEHIASVGGQIAALRKSCVSLIRKADRKVEALIDILRSRDVISADDRARLTDLGPFSAT